CARDRGGSTFFGTQFYDAFDFW
nr:immunoglobulin heavy chain junction region [Macaca mulatta]MOW87293.1 immunoglobulin heavy chain junction region [Macaca mulatta]MOW87760.1 immunoglobulin heavy chain junction region [Macaca mulatta]MOW88187.1 immunoglobulin heavy chain junction region [Macaca mulatta]MOW89766.1 immunoglobulin heavy chain junction region [Macaca mulatta]